jgi:hypothetical protein
MNASQALMIARFSASLGRAGRVVRRNQAFFFWVISDRFSTAVSCSARLIGIAMLEHDLSLAAVLRLRPLVIRGACRCAAELRSPAPGPSGLGCGGRGKIAASKKPGIWMDGRRRLITKHATAS